MTYDHAIIGDGVIGLAIAYELSRASAGIAVVAPPTKATTASWAAAGMLPPADFQRAPDDYERLRAISLQRLADWCKSLRSQTGIDPEWTSSGAIHVATTVGEAAALAAEAEQWSEHGIEVQRIQRHELAALEPALDTENVRPPFVFMPQMAQVRPRSLVSALYRACELNGVQFYRGDVRTWLHQAGRATGLLLHDGSQIQASNYCVAAGVRSPEILKSTDVTLEIPPWRGQMLLLATPTNTLRRILCSGQNYLVPRRDGTVLVGSTMEEAGMDATPTEIAIEGLRRRAEALVPNLQGAKELDRWAGLRPGTRDGFPFLGPIPGHDNVFAATGHFRHGISLAAGTAVVMAQLLREKTPELELGAFRVGR